LIALKFDYLKRRCLWKNGLRDEVS
jgi:hypothetical protein